MKKYLLVVTLTCLITLSLSSQESRTVTYYSDDSIRLEMDVMVPQTSDNDKKPLFIYVHGGGFAGGERSAGIPISKFLSAKGFVTASITYTLYMKDKNFSCEGIVSEKIKAIRYGVSDLWLATKYFLSHADEYKIDTTQIFIGGSSAGAEVCLHAPFWDYTKMNLYNTHLTHGFKYAGVVAGAGAIMDLNLITKENMIPIMMFHGTCDVLVPYATAAHHYCDPSSSGWLMLFGSASIYKYITELGGAATLYTFCGGGHEYSNTLFEENMETVYSFCKQVLKKEKNQEHVIVPTNKSCERSEKYVFCR